MGNSLLCCLACAIPCGALDVVRIVHLDGHIDEYSRHVSAGEVMAANPNHVLSRPCPRGITERKILILQSPDSELKRGHIYFLIPEKSLPKKDRIITKRKEEKIENRHKNVHEISDHEITKSSTVAAKEVIIPEKKAAGRRHHRRRNISRTTIWQPQLESISEEA